MQYPAATRRQARDRYDLLLLMMEVKYNGYYLLYFCFCKSAIFKISVILYFSVDLLFFSRQLFSAVSRPSCTKFGRNVSSSMRFIRARGTFEKFKKVQKPGHNGQKKLKFRSNFRPSRHVFARCDETVNVFFYLVCDDI